MNMADKSVIKPVCGEKLILSHRELINSKILSLGSGLSEYSFSNLFLFREIHDYHVIQDDYLWIYGKSRAGHAYIMPLDDPRIMGGDYLKNMLEQYSMIFPVEETWLSAFDERFIYDYDEDDSDYTYFAEKLTTYAGRKMHKKKNLLNQFVSLYSSTTKSLTTETLEHAESILDEWAVNYSEAGKSDEKDYEETKEAISLVEELGLSGAVYYVDGEPAGFVLGEKLANDSFAVHFAKGLVKFKGIYQYMYNDYAKSAIDLYNIYNFEQDLGSPALRQAKESYRPDKMLKKYRIMLK